MNGPDMPADQPPDAARDEAIARFAAARRDDAPTAPTTPGAVADLWQQLDGVTEHPAIRAMRAQALDRLERPNLSVQPAPRWRAPAFAALAASLVVAVGLSIVWRAAPPPAARPAVPVADAGQLITNGQNLPRDVTLADGTQITLDSHTQMHLARGGRQVRLDYGRAFFKVHHDAVHPFAVQAGDMTVSDIGTRFEVSEDGGAIAVTLVEGAVRVAHGGGATKLQPGDRLTLNAGRKTVERLDAGRQTLWQSGMISADDVPARDIVAQYNRYLVRPIALGNPALGALRISGEFRLDDPKGFLDAVAGMAKTAE